jgi:FkbM family methyltransferase
MLLLLGIQLCKNNPLFFDYCPMNLFRFKKALGNLHRFPEIATCMASSPDWTLIVPAYIGIQSWVYPRRIRLARTCEVLIYSFEDLTSFWSVWFGDEYRVKLSDRVIVDAGANIGAFTLFAIAHSRATILSIEPFPENVVRLRANLELNHPPTSDVRVLERAVARESGVMRMSNDPTIPSHSKTVRDDLAIEDSLAVSCITLDELVDEAGGVIDLLKLDVEGSEYPFLEGGSHHAMRSVERFGIEYHGNGGYERLCGIVCPHGFTSTRHRPACHNRGIVEFLRC